MIILYACPFLGLLFIVVFIFLLVEKGFFAIVGSIALTLFCFFCLATALVSLFIFIAKKIDYENCALPLMICILSVSIGLYIGIEQDVFNNIQTVMQDRKEYKAYQASIDNYAIYNFSEVENIIAVEYKQEVTEDWIAIETDIDKREDRFVDLQRIILPRNFTELRLLTTNGINKYYVYLSGNINKTFHLKVKGEEKSRIILAYWGKTFCQIDNRLYRFDKRGSSILDYYHGGGLYNYILRANIPKGILESKKEKL